jgi:1-deoxy-D-xylulose 5-phosphate reductoisomerase
VGAFLEGKIGFIALSGIIEEVLRKSEFVKNPSLDDLILTNDETRTKTELLIHSNHF